MFFFQLDDHYIEFAIFGGEGFSNTQRNTSKVCTYQRFEDGRLGTEINFPSIDIGGHKMVGCVWMPASALMDHNGSLGRCDLVRLMYHHQYLKASQGLTLEFEEWLSFLPLDSGIVNQPYVGLPSVLRSYDGKWFYTHVVGRKLKLIELTETCFIKNGVITTLANVEARHLQAKEEQLRREVEYIRAEQAERKRVKYKLVDQLEKSQVLNYIP